MECPRCGYAMGPFDVECKRCKRVREGKRARPRSLEREMPQREAQTGETRAGATTPPAPALVDRTYEPSPADRWASSSPVEANYGLAISVFLVAQVCWVTAWAMSGGLGVLALVVTTSIWIATDVARLQSDGLRVVPHGPAGWSAIQGPFGWTAFGLWLWNIALPWYVVARDKQLRGAGHRRSIGSLYVAAGLGLVGALLLGVPFRDQYRLPALHAAAYEGRTELAGHLLEEGSDVNERDEYGWTPLHWAAAGGHTETVALLLAHGGDANARADDFLTPLRLAMENGHPETAALLRSRGGTE